MKRFFSFLIFVCFLLIALAAFAQDAGSVAPPDPSSGPIATFLHSLLMGVASLAAAAIVAWATSQAKRNGIDITAQQQDLMKQYATQAIAYAEEKAADAITRGIKKLSASDKLSLAENFFMKKAKDAKLPVTTDHATAEIHAALPSTGFGATVDPVSGRPQ